jgi:molybdopterin molybdotransferase
MTSDRFISVERARETILEAIEVVPAERVFLSDCIGRSIAETIRAPDDVPAFDNSSRDGYAFRWADVEDGVRRFNVVATSAAGQPTDTHIDGGQAARIMTGAKLPDGADTVVMQEHVEVDGDSIVVDDDADVEEGSWVRHAGRYLSEGEVVLEAGARVTPAGVGLLASFGRSRLDVHRKPRVGIVSTGDELVDIDQTPGPGQIVNSNAHLLESLVEAYGGEPIVFPAAQDTEGAVRQVYEAAIASSDIVISSGGVSVGDHDVVGDVVDALTGGMQFWKIRMKPGKPLAFGTARDGSETPLLGLPGNPNSCFVCFHQFVRPVLGVAQGAPAEEQSPRQMDAILQKEVTSTPHRRQYLAGRLKSVDGTPRFTAFERQASANTALFVDANAFGLVPEGVDHMSGGDRITVEPIDSV